MPRTKVVKPKPAVIALTANEYRRNIVKFGLQMRRIPNGLTQFFTISRQNGHPDTYDEFMSWKDLAQYVNGMRKDGYKVTIYPVALYQPTTIKPTYPD